MRSLTIEEPSERKYTTQWYAMNHEKDIIFKMSKPPVFVLKTGGFGPSGETRTRGILVPKLCKLDFGIISIQKQMKIKR